MNPMTKLTLALFAVLFSSGGNITTKKSGGFKEFIKKLLGTYAMAEFVDFMKEFLSILAKHRVVELGSGLGVRKFSPEEIVNVLKPIDLDADFVASAIKKEMQHPDAGSYILVAFHRPVSLFMIFVVAFFKRWKLGTMGEMMSVQNAVSAAIVSSGYEVVCPGTVFKRPSAALSLAIPSFIFRKKRKIETEIALYDIDEGFDGESLFLFRVR